MRGVPKVKRIFKEVARTITEAKYRKEVKIEKYWIWRLGIHYVKVL